MTKKEKFGVAIEMAKANNNEMLVEFFQHEIELLERKKSNGNTKVNEKMERTLLTVYNALDSINRPATASELIAETDLSTLQNEYGNITSQKVAAYLNKLVVSGKVTKFTEKKKTYFKVVTTDSK